MQAACDYRLPLKFEDEVEVDVSVREVRPRALVFGFAFRKSGSSEVAAEGSITAVCASHDELSGRMRAIEIPGEIRDRLAATTSVQS